MQRINIPEGMMKAAHAEAIRNSGQIGKCLEAALLWLSENPIAPTHEQTIALCELYEKGSNPPSYCQDIRNVVIEWQRQMFLAPEPVEDYADRILKNASSGYTPTHAELDKIWNSVFLAGNGWVPPALRNRKDDFSSTAEIDAAIPDLVLDQPTHVLIEEANRKIREAYRRGRKAGSK